MKKWFILLGILLITSMFLSCYRDRCPMAAEKPPVEKEIKS